MCGFLWYGWTCNKNAWADGRVVQKKVPRAPLAAPNARRDPKSIRPGVIDKRVQYTIEGLFAARKAGFADYPAVPDDLDLVERDDQITFELSLDDKVDREDIQQCVAAFNGLDRDHSGRLDAGDVLAAADAVV